MISLATERNIPVVFDASEPALRAGLEASPTYVKPNLDELQQVMGCEIDSVDAAFEAGLELQQRCETMPIITLGNQGALALLSDRSYFVPLLPVEVVNAAGAGDGVLAGLATAVSQGLTIEEGLRLGFAIAAAVLLTPGTADCRKADVMNLIDQVELVPFKARKFVS